MNGNFDQRRAVVGVLQLGAGIEKTTRFHFQIGKGERIVAEDDQSLVQQSG